MAGIHSRILAVMDSVEEDLDCRIRLDDVSRRSGLSKYHLHRVFKSLTGRNLGEYIRARKLAASLGLLLGGELRVADIAAQLGFADYSAYTHAFKREFGISPTDYRRQPRELPVTNRLGRYDLYGSAQSVLLRPTILAKPAFTVVGKPFRMEVGENLVTRRSTRVAVQFFQEFAPEVPNAVNRQVYVGLTLYPEGYPEGRSRFTTYVPSVEVSRADELPPGMEAHAIPAQTYAVFRYVGLHRPEEIDAARLFHIFRHVFEEWLPRSGVGRIRMSFERLSGPAAGEEPR